MKRKNYINVDITNQKFGKLLAIHKIANTKSKWLFQCDCGRTIELYYSRILCGQLSCGCLRKECADIFAKSHITHHSSKTKLYRKYRSMLARCYDKTCKSYPRYGKRGITVCDEWKNSFLAFQEWAYSTGYDAEKDSKYQSLDRIDNNKGYSPSNCRWATAEEQQKNREVTKLYLYNGVEYSASEFARKFGITDCSFVYNRLKQNQSLEQILDDWNILHNTPSNLISVKDYSLINNIQEFSVRRKLEQGKLKGVKIGKKWFVEK